MKTNRTLKLITLTAAIFGFAATSFGQSSATASLVDASATIISPITITNTNSLNFGVIVPDDDAAGTVILPATAGTPTRTTTGGANVLTIQTGNPTAASFNVAGANGYSYAVTVPANGVVSLTGDGDAMAVDNFTTSLTSNKGTIGTNNTFYVGATLSVGAAQVVGTYSATFDVTVAYE